MSSLGGVRPLLINRYEMVADRLLAAAADAHGDRLLTKVRLADAVDLDGMRGLRPAAKSYAMRAHLDFVMIDTETSVPKFAVELDGRQHWQDARQRRRDEMKDNLCEQAKLPLLRVANDFARREGRWQVLEYVVDTYYRAEIFFAGQQDGYIPRNEPFHHGGFLRRSEDGTVLPRTLDAEARRKLWKEYGDGRLPIAMPNLCVVSVPAQRAVRALSFLLVAPDRYLISDTRARDFWFYGITPGELAGELAVAEIGHLVAAWLDDQPCAVDGRSLAKRISEVQDAIDASQLLFAVGGAHRLGDIDVPDVKITWSAPSSPTRVARAR